MRTRNCSVNVFYKSQYSLLKTGQNGTNTNTTFTNNNRINTSKQRIGTSSIGDSFFAKDLFNTKESF